jgi:nicotinamide riboside transporter PnuC
MGSKLEWIGAAFGIIGAFTVASHTGVSGYGYIPFLIGAVAYVIHSWQIRNVPLLLLNATFATANIYGITQWIV